MPNLSHQWESVSLKEAYARNLPAQAERLKRFKSEFGSTVIGEVTVEQALGGMRGVTGLVWEGSVLDPEEGIKFRGLTIDEVRVSLGVAGEREPQPEALFWLLLTGQIPNEDQVAQVSRELAARGELPGHVETLLDTLPRDLHPMAQLSIAVTALEGESHFARAYLAGVPRGELWEHTYEDALNLIAKLPAIAGRIYHNVFGGGQGTQGQGTQGAFVLDPQADYSENLCRALGVQPDGETEDFHNLMRLYLTIHADHEGGNVSAHTTHLVGSALSSPYLSFAAGLDGLAGPLHGRANQEVLEWLLVLKGELVREGKTVTDREAIRQYLWRTLNSGKVVPGYGHAVLRKTDPRFLAQREFGRTRFPGDELYQLVSTVYEVAPQVLKEHGKTRNPYPNVDAHSGVLLTHYGLDQPSFYTVLFGISRCFGVMAQLITDRALGAPIERPKSLSTDRYIELATRHHNKL